VGLKKGDLIRWIIDYNVYEASEDEVLPIDPIYAYGIIFEVSVQDPNNVVVCQIREDGTLLMIHMIHDGFELVSSAKN
tara:strand:- start:310 stop:543 length:234 start_codon:yes stop_codon:yes gene_type:complete